MPSEPANILNESLTEAAIARVFAETKGVPCLPVLGDAAWHTAAGHPAVQSWLQPVRDLALQECEKPLPELTDDLFREFYATGTRKNFEDVYFERRRMLGRAAISALVDGKDGKCIESTVRKFGETLAEFSWALPAHVNAPSGKDAMHIDLFSAEMANMMAELAVAFGAKMPADLMASVRWRIHREFLENYLHRHEDFWWAKAANHWNPVCHQGILGACLCLEQDPALLARLMVTARKYLSIYLDGFGRDGECSEGPGYWQYGFGAFSLLNEQLERRTAGVLSFFAGNDGVREIAQYGPRMCLSNFRFINFADSPSTGSLSASLLAYLGEKLGDPALRAHSYRSYARLSQAGVNLHAQRSDFLLYSRLVLRVPPGHEDERQIEQGDVFLRDHGILIARGRDDRGNLWEFAAKGGNNAEHHNHNDCGSFILDINGTPVITEIGAPEYTRDYFRESRYHYLAARTLGHSLPVVNGCEQAAGPQYAARTVTQALAGDHAEFTVDITACYPGAAGCADLSRSFFLDKKSGVLRVKEYYELTRQEGYETALITSQPAVIENGVAVITADGLRVVVAPVPGTIVQRIEEQEYRNHDGKPGKVNRIVLKPENLFEMTSVAYQIALTR
jgi:hypothetical protein